MNINGLGDAEESGLLLGLILGLEDRAAGVKLNASQKRV